MVCFQLDSIPAIDDVLFDNKWEAEESMKGTNRISGVSLDINLTKRVRA